MSTNVANELAATARPRLPEVEGAVAAEAKATKEVTAEPTALMEAQTEADEVVAVAAAAAANEAAPRPPLDPSGSRVGRRR